MSQSIIAADVTPDGQLRLPKPIRQALHLGKRGGVIGFIVEGRRVLLTKAAVVPEPTLSDEELASLARLSKRGTGRRALRTTDAALRYLWSL